MKHMLCASVSRELEAYHDGELSVEEQIVVEAHLSDCYVCASEARSLRMLRDALRTSADVLSGADHRVEIGEPAFAGSGVMSEFAALQAESGRAESGQAVSGRAESDERREDLEARLASMSAAVISRVKAERAESLSSRVGRLFEDLHLVWAALAASTAVATCAAIVAGVLYFAPRERSDSLAAVLAALAAPGSDRNPMLLDRTIALPRFDEAPVIENMPLTTEGTDVMLTVSGVVTRDGRVTFPSLLSSPYSLAEDLRVINQVSATRFEPAMRDGAPVAVSLVWLLERTTVRANFPGVTVASAKISGKTS
jgi:Putative zinc-finger